MKNIDPYSTCHSQTHPYPFKKDMTHFFQPPFLSAVHFAGDTEQYSIILI